MKTNAILLIMLLIATVLFFSCKDDEDEKGVTDDEIIAKISESGYSYFSADTLQARGPHVPFILVRFNPTAKSVLNEDNKIEPGQSFPEGSIIVKEIYNTKGGDLVRQYVMLKKANDPNAATSWVWSAYSASNAVEHSVTLKGVGCFECHATAPNRDGVKMFDIH